MQGSIITDLKGCITILMLGMEAGHRNKEDGLGTGKEEFIHNPGIDREKFIFT